MVVGPLAQLLSYVALVSLILGLASAVAAGRKIARYRHDAELAAKKMGETPVLGIVIYILVAASLLLNVAATMTLRIIVLPLQLGIRTISGAAVEAALAGLASFFATLGVTYASYKLFQYRYRRVRKYLTREAKLVTRAASDAKKASSTLASSIAGLGKPLSRATATIRHGRKTMGIGGRQLWSQRPSVKDSDRIGGSNARGEGAKKTSKRGREPAE